MKKCILHVHLMDLPSLGVRNGKCQSYGIHLRYWSEGLIIVKTMNLLKAFGDKTGFVCKVAREVVGGARGTIVIIMEVIQCKVD
jgi:hypothetical protein